MGWKFDDNGNKINNIFYDDEGESRIPHIIATIIAFIILGACIYGTYFYINRGLKKSPYEQKPSYEQKNINYVMA